MPEQYESALRILNIVFTALFSIECFLKMFAFDPWVVYLAHVRMRVVA